MKEKILAALVAVNGQYNLSKEYLEKIALTAPKFESEDEISSWVDSQKPMMAIMQSYADNRVSSMKKELDELKKTNPEPPKDNDLDKRLGIFEEKLTKSFEERLNALQSKNEELTKQLDGYQSASKVAEFEKIKKRVANGLGISDAALKFAEGRLTSDMDEAKVNESLSKFKTEMISLGLNPVEGQHYTPNGSEAAKAYAKNYLDRKEQELK